MTTVGTEAQPLRVAIIGSGPSAFYAADHLLKQSDLVIEVDMFDRLPTPFGLVRGGVAPDHQKIKTVTKAFNLVAKNPRFRFFGYVEYGKDLSHADLVEHYHQILYATGAQSDRHMGIPGEDLTNSFPATAFVAWYNGHPDYRHLQFDLSQERVAVVGVGNVAIDVARILCLSHEELARTDIADHALEALSKSNIKEVYLLGRRGPAQAAFTTPEVKELGELEEADVVAIPSEVALDDVSRAALEAGGDKAAQKKVELLQGYAERQPEGKKRRLIFRFLVSPTEVLGDSDGRVAGLRLAKNELYASDAGSIASRPTGESEDLPVGLVFRSVGYRGAPLVDVPFNERWGTFLNQKGRILDPTSQQPKAGEYTAGWIKRGPSGVIGTNKPDAVETVQCMLEDVAAGQLLSPSHADRESIEKLVQVRQPNYVTFADWQRLDEIEVANGVATGRPRVKFTSIEDMLAAIGKNVTA
ncbi:FAD-dependent oxidoreductase [Herpetosiphon sp. NSE202]|uniref:FAD-dependent oxidoreductase n=1 Tax=Herpetosiphon sp. NSE202 TaxID=3351349 RepID=UPI0036267860